VETLRGCTPLDRRFRSGCFGSTLRMQLHMRAVTRSPVIFFFSMEPARGA
jgi:hypothetical protein